MATHPSVSFVLSGLLNYSENTGRAVKDFAILRDPQLDAAAGYANGITTHPAVGLRSDEHGRLRLTVKLLEVNPQRKVEINGPITSPAVWPTQTRLKPSLFLSGP